MNRPFKALPGTVFETLLPGTVTPTGKPLTAPSVLGARGAVFQIPRHEVRTEFKFVTAIRELVAAGEVTGPTSQDVICARERIRVKITKGNLK